MACFGHLNAAKRVPQLLDAFERVRRRFPDALLVLAGSAPPGLRARLGEPGRRRASARPPGRAGPLAAPRRLRRLREPPVADDGRDLGDGDPRALARQAARRQRCRLVFGAARLGRGQGARRRVRGRDAGRVPRAARGGRRSAGADGQQQPEYARPSTISTASPISMSPRWRRVAGGPAVHDAVLTDVARAAHEVGMTPTTGISPRSAKPPVRSAWATSEGCV